MQNNIFKEIDKDIEKQIAEMWGNWVTEYGCLHYGDGCYSLAAIYDGRPVGFISTYPVQLPVPLQMCSDAYIDDLEVHEDFRRQGIARELLSMTVFSWIWSVSCNYARSQCDQRVYRKTCLWVLCVQSFMNILFYQMNK